MEPDLYIVLRTIVLNGVIVERDRYISNFGKRVHADAYCDHANNMIGNASKELDGITVIHFIKPVEAN